MGHIAARLACLVGFHDWQEYRRYAGGWVASCERCKRLDMVRRP